MTELNPNAGGESEQDNPLQGYFDWQVTTLLLAHDLADPLQRGDDDAAAKRYNQVQDEVRQLVMDLLPQQLKDDPNADWPPEMMRAITLTTLRRAGEIAGVDTAGG